MGGVGAASLDERVNSLLAPLAQRFSDLVFYSVPLGDSQLPVIVAWLIVGAVFFTLYFGFINFRGFGHALRLVRGDFTDAKDPGEVSHFQALTTAVSGTVGVGNISHVAIAISVGGPGACFWLIVAGLLGMSTKFVECTLGVKYRIENEDGTVSGGPMFYIDQGLAELGWPRLGKGLAVYYAVCITIGCLGIGCMFQSNQAFVQFVNVTGGESSWLDGRGWLFGSALAVAVGFVIVGGIQSIARVTSKLVPLMALIYVSTALVVILANFTGIPAAVVAIVKGAFTPEGATGGAIAVMILGFRRAVFSNEAGLGSSSIAHSAVRTNEPATEGFVGMLEPFIDTVVICAITALVITLTVWEPGTAGTTLSGIELTSSAFASVVPWFPFPLAVAVILFAVSTMISWAYYGLSGFVYLVGYSRNKALAFNLVFCLAVVIGCTMQLQAILDFSDSMVFAMALANVLALYMLAPTVKRELAGYLRRREEAANG